MKSNESTFILLIILWVSCFLLFFYDIFYNSSFNIFSYETVPSVVLNWAFIACPNVMKETSFFRVKQQHLIHYSMNRFLTVSKNWEDWISMMFLSMGSNCFEYFSTELFQFFSQNRHFCSNLSIILYNIWHGLTT